MIITPCASPARDGILAPWAAMIVAVLHAIVEAILAMAENIRGPLAAAWRPLPQDQTVARRTGLSRQTTSKPGFLPPSASARKGSAKFGQVVMMPLRGKSEARIEAQFARSSAARPFANSVAVVEIGGERVPT